MTGEQALEHNAKIAEKIKELRQQQVSQYTVKVVERLDNGRRQATEENTTDYIEGSDVKGLYDDYRGLYPDKKRYFVVISEVENIKRVLKVALPTRTDDDREPPAHLSDPATEQ